MNIEYITTTLVDFRKVLSENRVPESCIEKLVLQLNDHLLRVELEKLYNQIEESNDKGD